MHERRQMEGQLSAPLAVKERKSTVDLIAVGLLSLVVGAGTGLISAAFRLVLAKADRLRDAFVLWAQGQAGVGFLSRCWSAPSRQLSRLGWFGDFRPMLPGADFPMSRACCASSCLRPRRY